MTWTVDKMKLIIHFQTSVTNMSPKRKKRSPKSSSNEYQPNKDKLTKYAAQKKPFLTSELIKTNFTSKKIMFGQGGVQTSASGLLDSILYRMSYAVMSVRVCE